MRSSPAIRMVLPLIIIFGLSMSATANEQVGSMADTASDEPFGAIGNEEADVPSMTEMVLPSMTRIGLSLLAIIAVIYVTVFALRKLSGNHLSGGKKGKTIQIIEQTYLAPKKSVILLKLPDRAVLVGVTDSNINLLTEFELDAIPDDMIIKTERHPAGFSGFLSAAAGKWFGGKGNQGVGRGPTA